MDEETYVNSKITHNVSFKYSSQFTEQIPASAYRTCCMSVQYMYKLDTRQDNKYTHQNTQSENPAAHTAGSCFNNDTCT